MIATVGTEERAEVQSVLSFPEGSVGALMQLDVVTVGEESLSRALIGLLERAKLLVEPAGAAGVAALGGRAFARSFRLARRVQLDARVPATTAAHARLQSIVAECTNELGVRRAPAVVETTAVTTYRLGS